MPREEQRLSKPSKHVKVYDKHAPVTLQFFFLLACTFIISIVYFPPRMQRRKHAHIWHAAMQCLRLG